MIYELRIYHCVSGRLPALVKRFETITLAPIDVDLVEPKLLTAEERDWLNAYHVRVREQLSPLVDSETNAWLDNATRAV